MQRTIKHKKKHAKNPFKTQWLKFKMTLLNLKFTRNFSNLLFTKNNVILTYPSIIPANYASLLNTFAHKDDSVEYLSQIEALNYTEALDHNQINHRNISILFLKFADCANMEFLLDQLHKVTEVNSGYLITVKMNSYTNSDLVKVCDQLIFLYSCDKSLENLVEQIACFIKDTQLKQGIDTNEIDLIEMYLELVNLSESNLSTSDIDPDYSTSCKTTSYGKLTISKYPFINKRSYATTSSSNPFNLPMNIDFIRDRKITPVSIYFSYSQINDSEFIVAKVSSQINLPGSYTVCIKLRYNDKFAMAGSQFGLSLPNDLNILSDIIVDKIANTINKYGPMKMDIQYVQLILVKLRTDLISEFGLSKEQMKLSLTSSKNAIVYDAPYIPISINQEDLGESLVTRIDESTNLICDIIYQDKPGNTVNFWKVIQARTKFLRKTHVDRMWRFDHTFKFYAITSNGISCILAVQPLDNNTINKIRFSTTGVVLEFVTDSLKHDGTVQRITNRGNSTSYFMDKIKYYKEDKLSLFPIPEAKNIELASDDPSIGTIDTETYKASDGSTKVYCLGFKTNLDYKPTMYYVDSPCNINSDEIVLKLIDELLRPKYAGITFYCHNLSYDATFIMGILSDYNVGTSEKEDHYKMDSVWRDKRLLSLTVSRKIYGRKQTLIIQDSAAILPGSLRSLAKDYEVKTMKGIFPYKFASERTLFYIGDTPNFKYYENITLEVYKELVKSEWNFKEESLSYLNDDLSSLYEVIRKANQQLLFDYGMDLTKCLTISKLALNLFLTQHYPKQVIPNIDKSSIYQDIKLAYYGGKTEVYCPHGKDLYHYDVNSLYPSVAFNSMPGLNCTKMEKLSPNYELKENLEDLDLLFGFYYCNIETPLNSYLGLLPVRNSDGGIYFPVGKWSGWYFSEELKFATKHGYKITVIKGYTFNKVDNVFDSYINTVFAKKVEASLNSNSTQKTMAKSLLNNLLGRFGIQLDKAVTEIVTVNTFENTIYPYKEVKSEKKLSNDKILVTYVNKLNAELINEGNFDMVKLAAKYKDNETQDIGASSIVISAAITAYARIRISEIQLELLKSGGKIYYSDTDSLVTDIKLPDKMVHNTHLGLWKQEYELVKGIFISGKTYYLEVKPGWYKNPANRQVFKAKGVKAKLLTYEDYTKLLHNIDIKATKLTTKYHFDKGYSTIKLNENVALYADSYKKRVKLYDA